MTQEIPDLNEQLQLDQALTPELAFGAPLNPEQLQEMTKYIATYGVTNYGVSEADQAERKALVAEPIAVYTPLLGKLLLETLRNKSVHPEGVNTYNQDEVEIVTRSEVEFQRMLSISFISGHRMAVRAPLIYRALVGNETFKKDIHRDVEQNPYSGLSNAPDFEPLLDPAEYEALVQSAFDAEVAKERGIILSAVNSSMVRSLGVEQVRPQVILHLENHSMLGLNAVTMVRLYQLGLLSSDEVLDYSLAGFRQGSDSGYDIQVFIKQLPEVGMVSTKARVQTSMLEILRDPELSETSLSSLISCEFTTTDGQPDTDFTAQILATCLESHGDEVVLKHLLQFRNPLGPEGIGALLQRNMEKLRVIEDGTEKADLARVLASVSGNLLDDDALEVAATLSSVNVNEFVAVFGRFKYAGVDMRPDATTEILHSMVEHALTTATADTLFNNIMNLHTEFARDPTFIESKLLPRIPELNDKYLLNDYGVASLLSEGQRLDIAKAIAGNFSTENDYDLASLFTMVTNSLGIDNALHVFSEKFETSPHLLESIISNQGVQLSDEMLGTMVDRLVADQQTYKLSNVIKYVMHRLPKEKTIDIITSMIEHDILSAAKSLVVTSNILGEAAAQKLAGDILHVNPMALFIDWNESNDDLFGSKQQVLEYIAQDSRTSYAPKYFKDILKRLPVIEGSNAYVTTVKEATRAFVKINDLEAAESGLAMLRSIQASMPNSSERSEIEALNYANFALIAGTRVDTLVGAKQAAVGLLEERSGAYIGSNAEAVAMFEQSVGSLVPLLTYTLDIQKSQPEAADYMNAIIRAVAVEGGFKPWKYGDREALITDRVLPPLSKDQYTRWQRSDTVRNTDIAIGGAENVANQIRRIMQQNAPFLKGLEQLQGIDEPAEVAATTRQELQNIGRQIAAANRAKSSGELTQQEVSKQVSELAHQKVELEYMLDVMKMIHISADEIADGHLFNDKGRPTKSSIDEVLAQILQRNGDAGLDALGQIQIVISDFRAQSAIDIGEVVIADTDDFQTTIEVGANPVGSCQHYEIGLYRKGLVGYFDPTVKIITATNQRGRYIARAVTRLVSDDKDQPALVIEPTYMSQASDDVNRIIIEHAKSKAKELNIPLYKIADSKDQTEAGNTEPQLFIRGQRAPYLYSDAFGGIRERGEVKPRANQYRMLLVS